MSRIDNQQQYIDHNDSINDTFVDDLTLNNLTVTGTLTGSITHILQQAYDDSNDVEETTRKYKTSQVRSFSFFRF